MTLKLFNRSNHLSLCRRHNQREFLPVISFFFHDFVYLPARQRLQTFFLIHSKKVLFLTTQFSYISQQVIIVDHFLHFPARFMPITYFFSILLLSDCLFAIIRKQICVAKKKAQNRKIKRSFNWLNFFFFIFLSRRDFSY